MRESSSSVEKALELTSGKKLSTQYIPAPPQWHLFGLIQSLDAIEVKPV